MGTLGYRKPACKRGHVAPLRNKHGACVPCGVIYRKANYKRDRRKVILRSIAYAKENPEAVRDYGRAKRLGVPVRDVRAAIVRCAGKCEACGLPLTHKQMCVDHDHKTKAIRGVLCRFCNALEGMLNKQADRVALVQAYVSRTTLITRVMEVA